MPEPDPRRVAQRAKLLLEGVFGRLTTEEVLDWAVIHGMAEVRSIVAANRDELLRAWERFTTAGTVSAARELFTQPASDVHRVFILLTIDIVRRSLEGELCHFIDSTGLAAALPDWFVDLIQ